EENEQSRVCADVVVVSVPFHARSLSPALIQVQSSIPWSRRRQTHLAHIAPEVHRVLLRRHDGQNTRGFAETPVKPVSQKYCSFRKSEFMINRNHPALSGGAARDRHDSLARDAMDA